MFRLITAEAMAEQICVKPRTIREWARTGKIPSVRLSHKVVRFDAGDVVRSLRANEHRNDKAPMPITEESGG